MMDISDLSDLQSESGVVGTLLSNPQFIEHSGFLKPEHFSDYLNGIYYWAIRELRNKGVIEITALMLSTQIKSHEGLSKKYDMYNLPKMEEVMLSYSSVSCNTLAEYKLLAKSVSTYAYKRELVKKLNKHLKNCSDSSLSSTDITNSIYKDLEKMNREFTMSKNETVLMSQLVDDLWEQIVNSRTKDGYRGIRSKFSLFNDYFTYEPGELVVIQARYKQGKSVILMNEVIDKLRDDIPVLVVDTEMSTRLYFERLVANLAQVDLKKVQCGGSTLEEDVAIANAKNFLKSKKLVHIYDPSITLEEVYSKCCELKNSIGLKFVVYDYIKSNVTSASENYNVIGEMTDYLKNKIAGELNLSVVSACQLNRNNEVADSDKINRSLSVAILYGQKNDQMIAKDGINCGNAFAKIYVNRLGDAMVSENEYIDLQFDKNKMTITLCEQHNTSSLI